MSSSAYSREQNATSSVNGNSGPPQGFSFLFVLNELQRRLGFQDPVLNGIPIPLTDPNDYEMETRGQLFRYKDGRVEPAVGYSWHRNPRDPRNRGSGPFPSGSILRHIGDDAFEPMLMYSTTTVYNCSVGSQPSVYIAEVDALQRNINPPGSPDRRIRPRWEQMRFDPTPAFAAFGGITNSNVNGVNVPNRERFTRINLDGACFHAEVAPWDVAWIPTIVPEMYRNPTVCPMPNDLGGPLGIILARMALTQAPGHTDDPFHAGWWQGGYWNPLTVENTNTLRGMLAVIALDNYANPHGSTWASIKAFEDGIVVKNDHWPNEPED